MDEESYFDQVFLIKLQSIIEENYASENLGVEVLAREFGIIRYHEHRKLNAFSQPSARQLIKEFRLKKGHELLSSKVGTIG